MTLVNHYTSKDQAVIVTDSLAICDGRPAAFQPKFFVFPHAAMVLTGRGPDDVEWRAFWDLSHHYYAGGIDGAVKVLPGILEAAQAEMEERYPNSDRLATELAVVGYSPSEGGYQAIHFQSKNGFEPELQPRGVYLSPAPPGYRPGRLEAPSPAMWTAAALEQQCILQAEQPPGRWCSVGGDVFAVTLERSGVSIRKLCRLPNYEAAVEAMTRGEPRHVPAPTSVLANV